MQEARPDPEHSHTIQHIGAHALAGGIMSDLQGGKFGHGFISAGFTKWIGKAWTLNSENVLGNSLKQALVGGTVSTLTGGKFANGAYTAALQYIVNEAHTLIANKFSFTGGKDPDKYLEDNLKKSELKTALKIKRSGAAFDGQEIEYSLSHPLPVGPEITLTSSGGVELAMRAELGINSVAGIGVKSFVDSGGNIGVEASASMRWYEVSIKWSIDVVTNQYYMLRAASESLYRDATKGVN
jgi:hypothetical protein